LKEGIEVGHLFDFTIIIASGVQEAGVLELLAPGDVFLLIDTFE
jgi:hypothetical protein